MHIIRIRVKVEAGDGTSAEVETEVHGTSGPEDAADAVRDYRDALRSALGMARFGQPTAPPATRQDQAAEIDQLRPRRDAPPERPAEENDRGPETGRELIAWAGDRDMKPRVYQLGKAWKFPEKVLDWGRDDVQAVYHKLLEERSKQAPRNGQRNGYAGAAR